MSGNQEDSEFINEIFGEMDADNDGRITAKELFQALSKNKDKPKNYEIQKMFDTVDADGSGAIDIHEFKELAERWMYLMKTSSLTDKRHNTRRVGVDGKAIDAVTVSDNSRGLASEFVQKINRAALSICLDGWIKGDAAIIGSTADPKRFSFTWVPTGEVFSYEQFPDFYNKFKSDAEQMAGKYEAKFWDFIEHEEGDKLYNCGQWKAEGYDSGIYLMMAERGQLIFGKTTTAPGYQG